MKNPELAIKKYVFDKIGPTLGDFEYCDYPPSANFVKDKYIWLSTNLLGENGTKAEFISTVNAEFTLITKEPNGYNSTLQLEEGKELLLEALVDRGINTPFAGFNFLSINYSNSGIDFEVKGNTRISYSKINLNFVVEQIL